MLNATDTEPTTGKHWPGCVEPRTQRRVNSIGVVWVTCRGCGAYWRDADGWSDAPPTAVEIVAPIPDDLPPSVASGYRCAEHLDKSVNARGKGCPTCAADLKRRQPTRRRYDTEQGRYR